MQRRVIEIHGIVQGVGFRPYVYGLARRWGLAGFVQNRLGLVRIEVEGEPDRLDHFCSQLTEHPPESARIESLSCLPCSVLGERAFSIRSSDAGVEGQATISPDLAICRECVAELFDPANRRYQYPFISCAHCGPRLTIITAAPYDRARTTMASYELCAKCQAEYNDPDNRRFHAQTIACAECGPRLMLLDASGRRLSVGDPIKVFTEALRRGEIGAIKGLGGYHLCCDAREAAAVECLRLRKHRDEKPFAILVANPEVAAMICQMSERERASLCSPSAPILLLRKLARPGGVAVAACVAPRNLFLGVMLPYTPLHHLVMAAINHAPLVMTSGNRSDEPIAFQDEPAVEQLAGMADLYLTHDRPIHVRCDDSVVRVSGGGETPLRRSRGLAPAPFCLPFPCPHPILAVGGQLKGTFALGSGSRAFVSHHLGDLDHSEAYRAFASDIALYQQLFAIEPRFIARDLHSDYASTGYAVRTGLPLLAVQHHHAHLASCMAEYGLDEPVIGVTFDGAGLGTDGAIWGGEFLIGDYGGFRRVAHLRYVGLPGGEVAAREPWRMAASHLLDSGAATPLLDSLATPAAIRAVRTMLERKFNTPLTSSMGRLFDAVAALAGIRLKSSYEGQAAAELEWQASTAPEAGAYPWKIITFEQTPATSIDHTAPASWMIDTRPLIREVAADVVRIVPLAVIARRFHSAVVELIADMCGRIRQATELVKVVLTGGVFMNSLLLSESEARLSEQGFSVHTHRRVPTNDGGLSLGQLMIAARLLATIEPR